MTAPSAAEVIRQATSQVGVHESRDAHGNWTNGQRYSEETPDFSWSDHQPWCDTFVAWCSWKAGFSTDQWPRSASCDSSGAAFKKAHRWSEYPAVGAQVFFGTPTDLQHTGIVTAYDGTYIHTVEGNTNATGSYQGDGVYAKIHARRDARVIGYGYPKFPEGVQSADPAWQHQEPPKPLPHTKYVADYSFARPDPHALAAAGFRGVMRYVSPGSTKDLSRAEAAALHAAGLWIALVFESTAGRAGEGSTAGSFDAATAEAAADKLGYPADACIFYAVDFDASPAAVSAYFTGVHDAAKRPVGIYGGVKVIDAHLAAHGWQTEAWSGGKVSKHAVMLQHTKPALKIPTGTDENMLLRRRGFRVWKPDAVPPPPPPPPVHHHKRLGRRFGCHNIKSYPKMPQADVAADVTRTLDLLDVALLQEIDPSIPYYGSTVTEVAAAQGFAVEHLDTEDPILWRTEFRTRVDGGKQMTHPGKAKVSPNRYVTWTIFDDDTVAVNSHLVSKAFWSPKRGAKPTSYRWRRKMWKLHVQVQSQVIADLVNQGLTVILGGDMNHTLPRFHADQVNVLEGSLDGIAYVPAPDGPTVDVVKTEVVRDSWATDHALFRAWFKITSA